MGADRERDAGAAAQRARGLRTRPCVGVDEALLPLDHRLHTVRIMLSPRLWRRTRRILADARPLTLLTRARYLRRVLLRREHDEHVEITLPAQIASFDVARRGSRGLRLFDFSRRSVALLAHDGDQFARELRGVELGSRAGIGPRLTDHDVEERWFREELMAGLDILGRNPEQLELRPEAAGRLARDLLLPLWSAEPPRFTPTVELADRLVDEIATDFGATSDDPEIRDACLRLAHRLRGELASLPEAAGATVPLVWSHGGMKSSSMVEVDGRLRLVDWENADLRPPTSDAWHAVARWYRQRAPDFDETDAARSLRFMEAVRSEVLASGMEWREEMARALEPTAPNLRIWALAALRRRARRDALRRTSGLSQTALWLQAIEGMLRIDADPAEPATRPVT